VRSPGGRGDLGGLRPGAHPDYHAATLDPCAVAVSTRITLLRVPHRAQVNVRTSITPRTRSFLLSYCHIPQFADAFCRRIPVMDNRFDPWAFLLGNLLIAFCVWLILFSICGLVATLVCPPLDRLRWFLLTFFVLGPIGVAFAAIAPPKTPPTPLGYDAQHCPRCVARNNVPENRSEYICWRCETETPRR
jgi:4-amino-4-deoxy-L-arabinose transferase-like glycosyltransferase